MKKYWIVVLVALMVFVPSLKSYAIEEPINATTIVRRTSNLQYSNKAKDVKVLPGTSSISFKGGELTCDVKPELVGIYTVLDDDEPVLLDGLTKVDDETLLDPDIGYYLVAKFDLSSIGEGTDLDTYLKSNDKLSITDDSRFGENVVDMGGLKFGFDYAKSSRPKSILLVDFKYNNEEKYLMVAGEFFVTADTIAMQDSTITSVLSNSEDRITVEVEGNNLPDYSCLYVYEGDLSGKTVDELISTNPSFVMYAYNPNDEKLYSKTFVNQQQQPYQNIGDVSVSADKTKAVYSFITEDDGQKFETNKTYTLVIRPSGNREIVTWALVKGVYVLKTRDKFTNKNEVLNLIYQIDGENVNQYYNTEIVEEFDPCMATTLDNAIEILEEYFTGFYSIVYKFDLKAGHTISDYHIVFNGVVVEVLDVEGDGYLDAVGELAENNQPFAYEPDGWCIASTINLNYAEDVSKENNYTTTFASPNLTDFNTYYYQWQEKSVDSSKEVDATINALDINRTYNSTLDHKLIYSDADGEYFIYGDDFLDSKEVGDFENGIFGEESILQPIQIKTYSSKILIYSDKLKAGDTIYIDSDDSDLNVSSVYGDEDFEEIDTGFKYTLAEDDIESNTVKLEFFKRLNQFNVNSIRIFNSGVNWTDVDGETNATLNNPVPGKTYRCLGYPLMREYLSNPTNEVTIEELPASSGSSKSYAAKDTNKTAEKIAGSGKKGSKRTITPQDGRKVSSVIVRDKNGNKVDVTLNEDGTYSFIQPASDVTVEVNYKNREITLNIGSTEASVDGDRTNLDVCPVIRNDRTMLPIRFVAENLGAKVEWDEKNPNYVLITKGDIKIEITLGSDIMKVNGKDVKLDSVAFAENDRTYLPVRAVSENLNAIVEWNELRPMEVKIYER